MASKRLTKLIRKRINRNLMRHRFAVEVEALAITQAELALDVYKEHYDIAARRKMGNLPEGWLPTVAQLKFVFGSGDAGFTSLSFNGSVGMRNIDQLLGNIGGRSSIFMPVRDKDQGVCVARYANNHQLTKRFYQQEKDREKMLTVMQSAELDIRVGLGRATTIEALLKRWPEVEPLIPDIPIPNLPVILVDDLNKSLHLPVEEAA